MSGKKPLNPEKLPDMENILNFYARAHTPYLHANGASGTAYLLEKLRPQAGQKLLEIGFGTGQTMIELVCRFPGISVFGLEKSPEMVKAAQKRLRFAGAKGIQIQIMPDSLDFPFPSDSFDAVYCESVLAILPDADLKKNFREAHRVLKPGGRMLLNESLWRSGVSGEKIATINRLCVEMFGIPQASERWPFPDDWRRLAEESGFIVLEQIPLHGIRPVLPRLWDQRLARAWLFSMAGKLKSYLSPELARRRRQFSRLEKDFQDMGPYLEGVFFMLAKTQATKCPSFCRKNLQQIQL